MNYTSLGVTGLRVSRLAVGTAAFGLDRYGIPAPCNGILRPAEATELVALAIDNGINFFDTAPGYGRSEELLGVALAGRKDTVVATKVQIPQALATASTATVERQIRASLDNSLRMLRRDVLDIVQIHNATVPVLENGDAAAVLERACEEGKVRYIGASVYGEEAALAALSSRSIKVLQIAVSLLDQRMRCKVLAEANARGVGVLARSALLKGVLTEKARWLPQSLSALTEASQKALTELNATWETLPELALRFCASLTGVHSVLSGIRNRSELEDCVKAFDSGPLAPALLEKAYRLGLEDEFLLNPTYWKLEEVDSEVVQL